MEKNLQRLWMPVSETSSHIYNILNKIEKKNRLRLTLLLSWGEVSILAMDEKTCPATKYQTLIRREYQQEAQGTCSLAFRPPGFETNQFQSETRNKTWDLSTYRGSKVIWCQDLGKSEITCRKVIKLNFSTRIARRIELDINLLSIFT